MHTVQDGVDHLESLVNLLSHFRTSQDDLAADEDEKYNLRLDHTIDLKRGNVSVCDMTWKYSSSSSSRRHLRDQERAQARTS